MWAPSAEHAPWRRRRLRRGLRYRVGRARTGHGRASSRISAPDLTVYMQCPCGALLAAMDTGGRSHGTAVAPARASRMHLRRAPRGSRPDGGQKRSGGESCAETHDNVGHSMNVMLLQAGAARRCSLTTPKGRELLQSTRHGHAKHSRSRGRARTWRPGADRNRHWALRAHPTSSMRLRRGDARELEVQRSALRGATLVDVGVTASSRGRDQHREARAPGRAVVCISTNHPAS